jgi:hypothetical protein
MTNICIVTNFRSHEYFPNVVLIILHAFTCWIILYIPWMWIFKACGWSVCLCVCVCVCVCVLWNDKFMVYFLQSLLVSAIIVVHFCNTYSILLILILYEEHWLCYYIIFLITIRYFLCSTEVKNKHMNKNTIV